MNGMWVRVSSGILSRLHFQWQVGRENKNPNERMEQELQGLQENPKVRWKGNKVFGSARECAQGRWQESSVQMDFTARLHFQVLTGSWTSMKAKRKKLGTQSVNQRIVMSFSLDIQGLQNRETRARSDSSEWTGLQHEQLLVKWEEVSKCTKLNLMPVKYWKVRREMDSGQIPQGMRGVEMMNREKGRDDFEGMDQIMR